MALLVARSFKDLGDPEMKKIYFALSAAVLLASCGKSGSQSSASSQIKIMGSSTVYPFTKSVAEDFQRKHAGASVIVESTGTGAGMKLFCAGVGSEFPDVVN